MVKPNFIRFFKKSNQTNLIKLVNQIVKEKFNFKRSKLNTYTNTFKNHRNKYQNISKSNRNKRD